MVATRSKNFDWAIDNVKAFENSLNRLSKQTNDFRIPFKLIASDFYRSQKQLFQLKSAGLFQDLAPAKGINGNPTTTSNYKKQKQSKLGFVYPILKGESGDLSESTLKRSHKYSIFNLNKQSLEIGSSVPYGKFHQSDSQRSKIPQRKFIFIDGGQGDKSKGSGINGRRNRWIDILETHIKQLVKGSI